MYTHHPSNNSNIYIYIHTHTHIFTQYVHTLLYNTYIYIHVLYTYIKEKFSPDFYNIPYTKTQFQII